MGVLIRGTTFPLNPSKRNLGSSLTPPIRGTTFPLNPSFYFDIIMKRKEEGV
jgi:hypothetical protein